LFACCFALSMMCDGGVGYADVVLQTFWFPKR
jgi:hypothetical protein